MTKNRDFRPEWIIRLSAGKGAKRMVELFGENAEAVALKEVELNLAFDEIDRAAHWQSIRVRLRMMKAEQEQRHLRG